MSTFVVTVRQSVYESFVINAKTPQAAAYEAKKRMGETNWDEDDFEYDVVSGAEIQGADFDTVLHPAYGGFYE